MREGGSWWSRGWLAEAPHLAVDKIAAMTPPTEGSHRLRILHLSDMHLFGDNTAHYGIVDTSAALQRVLDAAAAVPHIDAVVCSGDLSDDGSVASYRTLQTAVEPWAASRGATVLYAMGNHDVRAGFEQVLGARNGAVTVKGVRILRLDSSVPGAGYGALDAEQLSWLTRELGASDAPAIVVLHHPPTPALTPLLAALELQSPEPLLEICSNAGVLAILAGHYHHPLITSERGTPVIVAPGIANTTDARAPVGRERATVGSGYAVIDIPDDILSEKSGAAPRVTIHSAPSADDGRVIFDLGPDEVAAIAAKAGPPAKS